MRANPRARGGTHGSLVAGYLVTRQQAVTAPRGEVVVSVAAVVVIALVVSGTVAVAHGVPIWVLAAGAFVGAVAGISGGRLILRLLLPEPAPDATTSTIDLRLDDDRID